MAITGSATQSAAQQAAQPYVSPVDAVNNAVGYPATEKYPGPVDASQYEPGSSTQPGTPAGPPTGDMAPEPFTAHLPHLHPGGGYQDTAWMTGTDGPIEPWDSSAGEPFAPSGALDPDLHGTDTGGVWIKEHVVGAAVSGLTRRTNHGQTTVKLSGDQVTRDNQLAPNGRQDMDQYQDWNPGGTGGYNPWLIPYSERPIFNNLAWQNASTNDSQNAYGVSGLLSDRAPFDYAAQAYEAPSDPDVQQPQPASGGFSTW